MLWIKYPANINAAKITTDFIAIPLERPGFDLFFSFDHHAPKSVKRKARALMARSCLKMVKGIGT